NGAQLDRLPPAERKELAGQCRGPVTAPDDLRGRASDVRRRALPGRDDARVAQHDHQDVVEVMRDTARQAADRFELRRLAHLLLDAQPFGYVLDLRDEVPRLGIVTPHDRRVELDPYDAATLVDVPLLNLGALDFAGEQPADPAFVRLAVTGMRNVAEGHRQQFVAGVADDRAECGIHFEPAAVDAHERHADWRVLHRRAQPLLARPELALG